MGRFLVPLRRPLFFIAVVLALARTIIRAYANDYLGVRKQLFGRTQTNKKAGFCPGKAGLFRENLGFSR